MTPYYERNGITIYCGDCLEVMPQLEKPFDAIIADLPYGTTACSWDVVIPFEALWEQYKRLTSGAVVLFGTQPFTTILIMSNFEWFKYCWVWIKNQPTGIGTVKYQPMRCTEDIMVFYKSFGIFNKQMTNSKISDRELGKSNGKFYAVKSPSINISSVMVEKNDNPNNILRSRVNPRNALEFDVVPHSLGTLHPTQKPVALLAYLIRTYTNPGNIVLDNTMGSGTTLVAAQQEGRRAVGIEISEEYCQIAIERLRQRSMFQVIEMPKQPEPKQIKLVVT